MTPSSSPRVEARGWGWRHTGRRAWALRGVDLVIEPGERVLLVGPSGAGKSTLLAGLGGLLTPEAGEADGELLLDGRPAERQRDRVGMLFQDPESQLVMARAGDDVAFGLENRCVPTGDIWPRVDRALAAVGFAYSRERATHALSGGEKQRLALAGTLALRPGLLLLDEPSANLDPEGADALRRVLRDALDASGATMVLVEHRVEAAVELVDRVVAIEAAGGVVADGPPAEVFARHGEALAAAGVWVPDRPLPVPRRRDRPAPQVAIAARRARFRYPGAEVDALGGIDVEVRSGEALAVVGDNGSGKSTLALLLAGLLRPTSGAVTASEALAAGGGGTAVAGWPARELVARIGTVFQDPEHQFVSSSVRRELMLGPMRIGLDDAAAADRADELLDRLHLGHLAEANPFTLSGGEKRRLSVATALATAPPVLILDEPTFGQDRRTATELLALLGALRDDGAAVVIVTHDRPFAGALADRRLALRRGVVASRATG